LEGLVIKLFKQKRKRKRSSKLNKPIEQGSHFQPNSFNRLKHYKQYQLDVTLKAYPSHSLYSTKKIGTLEKSKTKNKLHCP